MSHQMNKAAGCISTILQSGVNGKLTQVNAARPADVSGQHGAVHRLRSAVRQAPTLNQISWGSPDKAVEICAASAAPVH